MSFVRRDDRPSDKSRQAEIDFVINQIVNDTYCDDGVLERVNSRIDKLIEVVGELAKLLPYKHQDRLVQAISFNEWVQAPLSEGEAND